MPARIAAGISIIDTLVAILAAATVPFWFLADSLPGLPGAEYISLGGILLFVLWSLFQAQKARDIASRDDQKALLDIATRQAVTAEAIENALERLQTQHTEAMAVQTQVCEVLLAISENKFCLAKDPRVQQLIETTKKH